MDSSPSHLQRLAGSIGLNQLTPSQILQIQTQIYLYQQQQYMMGLDLDKSSHITQRKLRSDVWRHFEKYKDKDGRDWAKWKLCKKDFDGSSRSRTTHLRNHFKSCQRKTSGGGGRCGAEAVGNLTNQIAIKENRVNCTKVQYNGHNFSL
ncbi:hypothetical protein ACOSQ2_022246 [Xanthoceras sorbifolium]